MTAQTYDNDPLAQQHGQAVPENNLMEPHARLAEPDTDQAATEAPPSGPDADQAATEDSPTAADPELAVAEGPLAESDTDQAVAEALPTEPDTDQTVAEALPTEPDTDQTGHEDPASHPADAAARAGYESAASVSDYPVFTPDGDDGVQEPGADSSAGSPPLESTAFTAPDSAAESHVAGNGAREHGPWNEIQAMVVDDPRASIDRASGLVDDRVEALIRSVRERQRSMQSAWQVDNAGTEELRVALQHYRSFWNSLDDLPAQA
jgi:hypothetical protein